MKYQAIKLSRLHKAQVWYEKPLQVTIRIKKSTFIILGLIIYILWGHIVSAQSLPTPDVTPIQAPKFVAVAKISTKKPSVFKPVAKKPVPKPKAAVAVNYQTSSYHGTGDPNLDWIISRESGGNPFAVNASSGACGLGQSLPCSKVLGVCGSLSNVACQINWVRSYCISAYGSTAGAKAFWVSHSWY